LTPKHPALDRRSKWFAWTDMGLNGSAKGHEAEQLIIGLVMLVRWHQ
jgi:hypothetical protein